ncbi:hypothetical protein BOX15_Mlig020762g1 [Macrostomum lignano]|uniref:Calponin-homology (CH) domain-containing protein n=2 Tax=Macrostomum lignano TaxID=282301 RepID=A0A267E6P5_9PLAT|nr:hypothetical protein BOX15_Mlig020762g1 [Macrostomum lignano]
MADAPASPDVRSPEGHAAISLSGSLEGEWVGMQANTFLNWVNQNLSTAGKEPIDTLVTGFADGTKLVPLVEALQGRKLGRLNKPLTEHHRLENINMALQALAEDNVRLVNIGAEDIVKENVKLILGLVWHMILKYQIGKTSKIPSKKLMLYWVQAVIPSLNITNFTTDWNSGIALHALLDYCEPGTSANWRQLHRDNGLANCRSAMVLAKAKFNVPQIMQPEDLSSAHVDELSAMTYLSYFMNQESPGHAATLRWANRMLASVGRQPVDNFTTDWVNGDALCCLLRAMGAPPELSADTPKHRVERCFERANSEFRVEHVLTPDEFTNQDVDYLGVMAYVARLERACPEPSGDVIDAGQSMNIPTSPPPPPPQAQRARLRLDSEEFGPPTPNQPVGLLLDLPRPVDDKSAVVAEVEGPRNSRPQPHLTWLTDSRLRVEFTPVWTGRHSVSVSGADAEPLPVEVNPGSPHDVRLEVPSGLRSSRVTEARLDARCLGGGDVRAELRSPAGRANDVPVSEIAPGLYGLRLLGSDPGEWQLRVWIDNEELPSSPVTLVLLDSASVAVEAPNSVVTGQDTHVLVRHAAGAKLSAQVSLDGETVPCFVEDSDGDRKIHFPPNRPGLYLITINYGDEELRGSPFSVQVRNQEEASVDVAAIKALTLRCNRDASFAVNTSNAGPGELEVRILGPSGSQVASRLRRRDNGEMEVSFLPEEAGQYNLELMYAGRQVRGSPFSLLILDPSRVRLAYDASIEVGKPTRVRVDLDGAGESAPLALQVTSPSGREVSPVRELPEGSTGERQFEYTPEEAGRYQLDLKLGGLVVDGGPYVQEASQPALETTTAYGEGLTAAQLQRPTHFFVDPKGQKGDLFVQVDGPTSISACNIEPQANGHYRVSYTPEEVGHYSVQVHWNGRAVHGSPFSPLVLDLGAVRCVSGGPPPGQQAIPGLVVGRQHRMVYETAMAGPGRLSAEVEGPRGESVSCVMRGDSFAFTPVAPGEHAVRVRFGDRPLPGGAMRGIAETEAVAATAADHTKVILSGRGLKEARVNEEAAFLIDGSQAGRGQPAVRLSMASVTAPGDSHAADVEVQRLGGEKYKCTYRPQRPGQHLLHISWAERPLRGSPFHVTVHGPSEASRIVCSGEGLHQGVLGQEIKSLIDTRRAGPGDLTARCVGPTKPAYCELYDHQNNTYTLSIKPQESGKHELIIEYNGDQVPGSPFNLRVAAAPDASRVHVYGPGVEHGVLDTFQSRFVCETKGAGAGQLTVRIRGPRGAFRVEMEREYQKDRTIICRYDPCEPGEYQLHIKWSGSHVPGSPFVVNIFKTAAELAAYLERHPQGAGGGGHSNGAIFDF